MVVSGAPAVAGVSSQPLSASCASAAEASSAPSPHATVSARPSSTRTTSSPSPASTVSGTGAVDGASVPSPSPRGAAARVAGQSALTPGATGALVAGQSTVPETTTTQAGSEAVTRSALSATRTVAGAVPGETVTWFARPGTATTTSCDPAVVTVVAAPAGAAA